MANINPVPAPTPADRARDLAADLAVVAAATGGPWDAALRRDGADGDADVFVPRGPGHGGPSILTTSLTGAGLGRPRIGTNANAHAIAAMRDGWPAAIRRALHAEAECERLRTALRVARNRAIEASARIADSLPMSAMSTLDEVEALAELLLGDSARQWGDVERQLLCEARTKAREVDNG